MHLAIVHRHTRAQASAEGSPPGGVLGPSPTGWTVACAPTPALSSGLQPRACFAATRRALLASAACAAFSRISWNRSCVAAPSRRNVSETRRLVARGSACFQGPAARPARAHRGRGGKRRAHLGAGDGPPASAARTFES
eukprot:5311069-Prymnesium_polylepis.1